MKISVILVSYNKCKPLRVALKALTEATEHIEAEVIVIDNGSDDRTAETVMKEFPQVRLISSSPGKSFAKAGNLGLEFASGEYVLLLSPDALTEKGTLHKAIAFMDANENAGGLSVRMLDAFGNYLPASKKVLPKSWIAFLKVTGLAKQFPKLRFTERLTTTEESEFETSEIEVLNSNFMFMRNSALKAAGLLDDRFSGYGYNIDLSHRIRLAGFKNYYFPKTYIISLQIDKNSGFSWSYLKSFYAAMFIFAAKYLIKFPALSVKPLQGIYPQSAYELKG